jgi:hypothetical protein
MQKNAKQQRLFQTVLKLKCWKLNVKIRKGENGFKKSKTGLLPPRN